jgi:hypothetical protein
VDSLANFFQEFWKQATSFLGEVGDWLLSVFDPNSGPWPKIMVGGVFLLVALIVVSRSSRAR